MASGVLLRVAAGAACLVAACGGGGNGSAPPWVCMVSSDPGGRGDEPKSVAQVDRCTVSMRSFRFAYSMAGGSSESRRLAVIDALIARELLAQGAPDAGVSLPKRREVEQRITSGELFVMGQRIPAEALYRDGTFDHDTFTQIADRAGLSVNAVVDEETREMLALKVRDHLGEAAVDAWLAERCERAKAAGRLTVAPEVLESFDDAGKPLPTTYVPCAAWKR